MTSKTLMAFAGAALAAFAGTAIAADSGTNTDTPEILASASAGAYAPLSAEEMARTVGTYTVCLDCGGPIDYEPPADWWTKLPRPLPPIPKPYPLPYPVPVVDPPVIDYDSVQ